MKLRELKLFCHNVKSPKQGTTELKRAMKVAREMEGKAEAHMGKTHQGSDLGPWSPDTSLAGGSSCCGLRKISPADALSWVA